MKWHFIAGEEGCRFAVDNNCVAIIVDALRASATAAYMLHAGATEILAVREVETHARKKWVVSAEGRGLARLARELLPALDNLDRALAAAEAQPENADHHLTDGIRLVQREMSGALERVGIVQDAPHGEAFDPHRHEAIAQQPSDDAESGTIIEVYSPGYLLGDEVLRAAKVVVAS